jgi:hypothetical protein
MIPPDVLDRLFEADLADFTSTRNELAKELKSQGNDAEAIELKSIRKPTVTAWAVNRLARRHPDDVSRLFDVRDQMSSARNPKELRAGVEERKKLIVSLLSRAEEILKEAGHSPNSTSSERIAQTLQAGDTDEDRRAIVEGRLSKDLVPSGFGGFGGFAPMDADEDATADEEEEAREEAKSRASTLAAQAQVAEREAGEAAQEVERLRGELRDAEKRAAAAEKTASKARSKADDALDSLG